MAEEVDFIKFGSAEEALDAWLQPSLSLKIGINTPVAANPSPPPPPPAPPLSFLLLDQVPQPSSLSMEGPTIPQPPIGNGKSHAPSQDDEDLIDHPRYRQASRSRRNPKHVNPAEGADDPIITAFPWATDRRAKVHSLLHLIAHGLTSIVGEVQCKCCERRESVTMDLRSKFREVEGFVRGRAGMMHERAAAKWKNPVLAPCKGCNKPNCMRPVLGEDPCGYNWLFLFLGQSLGVLTLKDLKWFCKYTVSHRSGAKDRVLYASYMAIGKQLDPTSDVFIRPS